VLTVTDADGEADSASVVVTPEEPPPNQPPTAVITEPASCTDLDCSFDGSSSNDDHGIVSYAWDFGDGNTATGVNVSHTYASPGDYVVMLTVEDNGGLSGTDSVDVTVSEPSGPIAMTTAVAGFTYDGTWATAPLFVSDLSLNAVAGAEVLGEWTYFDRRGRERTKQVTGTSDENGSVTIRTRFKSAPPALFCVLDVTKPGYLYVPPQLPGFDCGGLDGAGTVQPE
jgi:hypothetical protein